eukprot:Platyproteum_vivax@DN1385_c0_g1_i1.p1
MDNPHIIQQVHMDNPNIIQVQTHHHPQTVPVPRLYQKTNHSLHQLPVASEHGPSNKLLLRWNRNKWHKYEVTQVIDFIKERMESAEQLIWPPPTILKSISHINKTIKIEWAKRFLANVHEVVPSEELIECLPEFEASCIRIIGRLMHEKISIEYI